MGDVLIENIKNNKMCFKNILEIGCGTGYVTRTLARQFSHAKITAVDIAPGMIEHVKSTVKDDSISFICGDIEEIKLDNTYDLIISNATFQWFNYLDITLEKLITALNPKGMLCFSTFGQHTFCELHQSFEKARQIMNIAEPITPGQAFYSLDELLKLCQNVVSSKSMTSKILLQGKEMFEYEYFDCCKDFLYSVKKIGANNSNEEGNTISPAFIEKVIEIYDESFRENSQVKATYHCLFIQMLLK
jgi:malonyl-CoA O-methyltransferase